MVPTKVPLFQLFSARMRWLGERQAIIGRNVANADTPDYRPRDLPATAFAQLAEDLARGSGRLPLDVTRPAHLGGGARLHLDLSAQATDAVFETAPDGNAVVLEEQMAKMATTALDYQLSSNLYRKYIGMVRTALGTQGQ